MKILTTNSGRNYTATIDFIETTSLNKGSFTTYKVTPNINTKMQHILINFHKLDRK